MEVHTHTHTPRKKWTHYFWEFIMLFLAVFCGFLAEYQLEHKIENDRERQYMTSMTEDLGYDTSMLTRNIKLRQGRIIMIDSFISILNSPAAKQKGAELYYLIRTLSPPTNIFPNDGTIQQLKSSGNLRLVRKREISRSIMAYDQNMRRVLFEMSDEADMRSILRQRVVQIFDTKVFTGMNDGADIIKPSGNPELFTYNASMLNALCGDVQYLRRIHLGQIASSQQLLTQATNLINDIKTEYHLK